MDKSGGGDSRDGGPSSSASSSPSTSSPSTSSSTVPAIGCGSSSGSGSLVATSSSAPMTLNVTTTTGGSFSVLVDGEQSVENLKKIISKKLKVSKDRICLLHRERELHDGTLRENGLMDGSKLILTPNVETGLLAQRAENTVMQALESLNDNQVNDFLSGKSPLNLSVRLGDHMMLIQLQLSTLNPSSQSGSRSKAHKSRSLTAGSSSSSSSAGTSLVQASSSRSRTSIPIGFRRVTADGASGSSSRSIVEHVTETQTFTKQELENIHSIVKNLAESENPTMAIVRPSAPEPMETELEIRPSPSESPIKSLSNLVSSSINSSNIPVPCNNNSLPADLPATCTDPISANLTSCLCKRLDNNDNNSCDTTCSTRSPEPQASTSTASLHRTAHNPIARHKSKVQTLRKHYSFDSTTLEKTELDTVHPVASTSAPTSPQRSDQALVHHSHHHHHHHQHYHHHHHHPSHQSQPQPGPSSASRAISADPATVENPALAEASRNLTQTLRKLSKRVFTNKGSEAAQEQARNVSSGAVIESMKHHGKGIYSGTFSGTLNPALQDKFGRPKRDISTIIHILNDLLSAAPQCARTGTKIYFEPSPSSASSASSSATNQVTAGTSSSSGTAVTPSITNGSNLQAAALMGPTTLTTPVAAPSPRLVSRCVPASIHTKKYPSNSGTTSTTVTSLGPSSSSSSCCSVCKSIEPQASSGATSSTSAPTTFSARCHHHHAPKATPKVLCKCGLPLTTTSTAPSGQQQQHCQRCAAAISAAELENSKTKSKLDNLRLIMQQKKERREARKQKCAPYSTTTASPLTSPLAAASSSPSVGISGMTTAAVAALPTHHSTFSASAATNTNVAIVEPPPPQSVEETMDSTPAIAATAAETAAAEVASESTTKGNSSSSSNTANSATATATATTTTTTAAGATSSEAAQSHQIVEEVDTVA